MRVVGLGNPAAGDDGAGLEVVRRLRERGSRAWDLIEMPQAGVELIEVLKGPETVMFVDAVSSGKAPGTLHLLSLPSGIFELRGLGSVTSHGWGLAEAFDLMAALGHPVPRAYLLGIEVKDVTAGAAFSPAVASAIQIAIAGLPILCKMLMQAGNGLLQCPRHFPPGARLFFLRARAV